MIGRTNPGIRKPRPRVDLLWLGRRLLPLSVAVCAAALAGPPAQAPQEPPQSPPRQTQPASPGTPDDDFIEFLGTDDVGDADWWEFLKKAPPHGGESPAPPPQEAKQ
jgi:hypothetical protein